MASHTPPSDGVAHDKDARYYIHLAAYILTGTIVLVVGIVLLAHYAIGSHARVVGGEDSNSPEEVAKRIKPVASYVVDPSQAPAPAAAPAAVAPAAAPVVAAAIPAAAPAAQTKGASGEAVYKQACTVCHGAGVAGAPKTGDKAAWGARVAQGNATLYEHALKGFKAMPAKGGNTALSDDDVKAAVDYLVAQAK